LSYAISLFVLLLAALMEAGGDRLMSLAMRGMTEASFGRRLIAYVAAAVTLTAYGYVVNKPDWDFGKLLGTYVAFFFFVAQLLAWKRPSATVLIGGCLIVAGGFIVSLGR